MQKLSGISHPPLSPFLGWGVKLSPRPRQRERGIWGRGSALSLPKSRRGCEQLTQLLLRIYSPVFAVWVITRHTLL
jgi:hypothetical protein